MSSWKCLFVQGLCVVAAGPVPRPLLRVLGEAVHLVSQLRDGGVHRYAVAPPGRVLTFFLEGQVDLPEDVHPVRYSSPGSVDTGVVPS